MAKVKKKKKKSYGSRRSGGGPSRETSNLRPKYVEKTPPCMEGCPNSNNIREMIMSVALAEKNGQTLQEAMECGFYTFVDKSPFPSTCGRVCPHPCETKCNRNEKDGAVNINQLERYIGDWGLTNKLPFKKVTDENRDQKVAIIGGGPGGLSCAYQLARRGYKVTVFEALPKAGGMLRYGIPDYRLPQDLLDAEIQRILDLGVELKCGTVVGKDIAYEDLKKDFDAVFIGIGAHKGKLLRIPNEDVENVMTGTHFLNLVNSGQKVDIGKKVIVIGGGDTAVDAARISKRLGAEPIILYRRTIKEMPAIDEEIEETQEEGIEIQYLAAPVEIIKNGSNRAVKMKCIKMELGEPDSSGRRRPIPIEGSEYDIDVDFVVAAISQEPDFDPLPNIREGRDWVKVDEKFETPDAGVYGGGDVTDLALVIDAIAHGRHAATAIDARFLGASWDEVREKLNKIITKERMKLDWYENLDRNNANLMPVEERFKALDAEVNPGLTEEQFMAEVKRCMSCGMCFKCDTCWSFCQDNAIHKPLKAGEPYSFKLEYCQGCKKCEEECPCGYIDME